MRELTCLAVVQLDLLEDQRKMILSRCAFTIQCCWRRYRRHRHRSCQQSATLIQAGNLLKTSSGTRTVLPDMCGLVPTFRLLVLTSLSGPQEQSLCASPQMFPTPEASLINHSLVPKDVKACHALCSGAVVAGQKEDEEMG